MTKDRLQRELEAVSAALSPTSCPDCYHPPIAHAIGNRCVVCDYLQLTGQRRGETCRHVFDFKLTPAEREQAMKADKMSFEQDDICAMCGTEWMQHHGYLCPSGDSTFVKLFSGSGAHKIV